MLLNEVNTYIDKTLPDKGLIIIDGVDGSGKSTIIQRYYASQPVFKCVQDTGHYYEFNQDLLAEMFMSYKIMDRHPAICKCVYEDLDDDLSFEYLKDKFNRLNTIRDIDKILLFINDRFIVGTYQEDFVLNNRKIIHDRYLMMYDIIKYNTNIEVFIVE